MNSERARSRSPIRLAVVAGALGIVTAVAGLAVVPAAEASPSRAAASPTASATGTAAPTRGAALPVGTALAIDLPTGTVLTLPAADGLRDRTTVTVRSGASGRIDVDAVRGSRTVHLVSRAALGSTTGEWSRTVAVPVTGLTAGRWRIRAERSADPAVSARSRTFVVGSGAPVHVGVTPAVRTLYPYPDGTLDTAAVTVVAKDETGSVVPVTGSIRIDAGKQHVTRVLSAAGVARLPITALPTGAATVTATVRNTAGKAVRRTGITLAPTAVGSLRIVRSSDTVQPVRDGLLDSVALTTTGAASAGSPAKVSGTLTVSKGGTIAKVFRVADGKRHAFTWDGRVNGVIVPGTWTVSLALKGPQGPVRTRTTTLVVTKRHLPYAVRDMFTVAAGNQQGLAVRNGFFYVGYDIGNGMSRIDVYDAGGLLQSSLGPLPIPHVAELGYSTTTHMLYAATGGAQTPTKVYVLDPLDPQWTMDQPSDPSAAIKDVYDYSSRLGNNAMVSVDDANGRLLVFSGSTGDFTISSATLAPSTATAADGTQTPVPAGTITATVPVRVDGVPQGMDLVGQRLWIYTSLKSVNHVAEYDLSANALLSASAASTSADLDWGGEGEGMAAVPADDTGDGLPAWIYVGAHDAVHGGPNRIGRLVPVTDQD